MSGPPPPPAPPGGAFANRTSTPPSRTSSPAPPAASKSPGGAGKAPPSAASKSPGGKAPAAQGKSPSPAAAANKSPGPPPPSKAAPKQPSGSPPPAAAAANKSPGPPPPSKGSSNPSDAAPIPPSPTGPKKVPPAGGQAAGAATPTTGKSPAKGTPPLPSGKKAAPAGGGQSQAVPPVPATQPAAAASGEPPAPNTPAGSTPEPAAPSGNNVAKKSPAGKKSPVPSAGKRSPAPNPAKQATATPNEPTPSPPAAEGAPSAPIAAQPQAPAPQAGASAEPVAPVAATPKRPSSASNAAAVATPAVSPIPANQSGVSPPAVVSPPPGATPINASAPPASILAQGLSVNSSRRAASPKRNAVAPRAPQGPLDRDPRSGLPLINFPADRQASLAHLGNDILLHFFEDCDRISSKGKPLRRLVLITDQTFFVCETNGSLLRCVQVSKISQVNVAVDNSNEVALVVPSEYDIILRFDRRSQRDDMLAVLRAVHKRMVSTELNVWNVKDIRPNQYRMEKPPGFQLQRIPQRSRANLSKALESIDANDRERRNAIQRVQEQLDFEHKQELLDKQQETSVVQSKLDEATSRQRQQLEELDKLRQAYAKIQRRVEEIDSQYGTGNELPMNKDMKIRELHEVVDALTASVTKANEERMRAEKLQRAGDFEEKDLDFVDTDITRLRGRSLHHQGLVEVLQRQLMEKQRELGDLSSKQVDLQKLALELHRKEESLKEIEQSVTVSSTFKDPSTMYSSAANANFDELLRQGAERQMIGGADSSPGSPNRSAFGGPQTLVDDIMRNKYDDEVLLKRGALNAPKQFFSSDIPEFRVPPDEKDFKEDPRTGLKFKDLEGPFIEKFPSLQNAILFFFAVGTKENKRGQSQKRVLMVTDQVVYQCTTSGAINRTFEIKDVREFQKDRDNQIAMVVEGLSEYDLLMRFKDSPDTCQELWEVMMRTSKYNKRTPPLVLKEVEHISSSDLRLEKPPTWEYVDRRARPRRGLYRALQQLSKTSAAERQRANNAQDELRQNLTNRIREELMPEVNLRREREYIRLRQQLVTMQTILQERQLEARNLMRQIQTHKCSLAGVKIHQTSTELFDTQGMYWIPTDPVVMECQLEILRVQFSGNFVVTSHPNGYLNVWDITTADLVRTLKIHGHTAKVTAFHFEGHQVISGGYDSALKMWHIMQPTPQFTVNNAHRGALTCVQFDASMAVSSGADGVINVWSHSPTALTHTKALKAHKSAIVGFKFERGFLASAEWGWVFVWDLAKGVVIRTLRDDNGGIKCVDLSMNRVLTGGTGGTLTIWNTSTGESEFLNGHKDDVHCVILQGHFAVSSSADGTVRMWDTKHAAGQALGTFHDCFPQEVKSFFFRANRFVAGEGTTIKCWTR